MKATVYFTREITPEKVVALYEALGRQLTGRVAVKLHSGEKGNQNFLKPEFWRPVIAQLHGEAPQADRVPRLEPLFFRRSDGRRRS